MIGKLQRDDLYSLEKYAELRPAFRDEVMAHKKHRQVEVGPHATLYFEDRLTMQYQIQEMLRVERIFETAGIEEELAAYNPLIPDGSNFKATFMLEYTDAEERRQALPGLIGIEECIYVSVDGVGQVGAIADEDLERTSAEKTSSVHFLRFELTPEMVQAIKNGADIGIAITHENYAHAIDRVPAPVRDSLAQDLA